MCTHVLKYFSRGEKVVSFTVVTKWEKFTTCSSTKVLVEGFHVQNSIIYIQNSKFNVPPPSAAAKLRTFKRLKPQFYNLYTVGLKATFWNMNSSFWAVWAALGSKEKKWIWVFLSNFWGWFFQHFVGKNNSIFFLKNCIR